MQAGRKSSKFPSRGNTEQLRDSVFLKDFGGVFTFSAEEPTVLGVFHAGYGKAITITHFIQEITIMIEPRSVFDDRVARSKTTQHRSQRRFWLLVGVPLRCSARPETAGVKFFAG